MKRWLLLLLPLLSLTLSGCAGYQLGNSKPSHLQNVTKLYVPTFKDNTLEPRLAVLVTNAVIKQLQLNGAYEIVGADDADATLRGTIDRVTRSQFRSVRTNTLRTRELLVRLRTDFEIVDSNGTKLHRGRALGESYVVLDPNWQTSERQGFSEAAERMAVSIASELSDGW